MLSTKLFRVAAILVACCFAFTSSSTAQDAKTETKEKESPKPNPYELPKDASMEELGKFLESLRAKRPRSREEMKQRIAAVYESSCKILEGKADEKYRVMASDAKLGVLAVMRQVDKEFEGPTQREFAAELAKDQNPKIALTGKHFAINRAATGLLKMTPAERTGIIEEAFALANEYGVDSKTFSLLNTTIARNLERAGRTKEAIKIYERLAPMMEKSENKRLVAYRPKLDGAIRRLKLPGNPIELKGTTDAGEPFDWAKYRGKVVLVDFWATWCRPCVAELPNMMKNYADYHEDGFTIVGVNMDSNRGRFDKFVADREVPWEHIMGTEKAMGWNHPIAAYYGIGSIPTQMLVGRDGKVIGLNLRGKKLDQKLEELFGPREDTEAESDEDTSAKKIGQE